MYNQGNRSCDKKNAIRNRLLSGTLQNFVVNEVNFECESCESAVEKFNFNHSLKLKIYLKSCFKALTYLYIDYEI